MNYQQEIEQLRKEISELKALANPDSIETDNYNKSRAEKLADFLQRRGMVIFYSLYLGLGTVIFIYFAQGVYGVNFMDIFK